MTGNPKILTTILNDFRILYFLIQFLDFLVNPWVRPPTPRAKPNLPPWSINHQPLLYLCDVHFSWIYQRGHCVTATVPLILANTTMTMAANHHHQPSIFAYSHRIWWISARLSPPVDISAMRYQVLSLAGQYCLRCRCTFRHVDISNSRIGRCR